ncbi:MAG: EAL domain-containing protein [Campylobacterota bacterium]
MSNCKCQESFNIPKSEGLIHFISVIPELNLKIKAVLVNLGDVNSKDSINTLKSENCNKFFEQNYDFFKENFSLFEQNEIRVFVENEDHKLNISTILKSKALSIFLNYIDDKSFFDILENEALTTHFQPIIDLKNDSIYAYEALTRGVFPDGTLMSPGELFEKSTRNDTNFKLDRLCRESALKTSAVKKINSKVFINFLPTSIYDPKFCLQATVKWAKQLDHDPKNIVFEVVETEKVQDKEHLKGILDYYRQQGFQVALDDVGEGYSSLNMLVDLQPDIIKVDRNIIDSIDKDSMKQSVYKALRTISNDNGIKLLAEGVETIEELNKVRELGADYAQGYYFAKPSAEPIRSIL